MRRFLYLFLFSFYLLSSVHSALPLEQYLYKGKAIPFYNQPTDSRHQKYAEIMASTQLAERMAAVVNGALMLKSDIGVGFESCGYPNALFSAQRQSIVICYEFLDLVVQVATSDPEMMNLPRDRFAKRIDGALWSVYMHELGHALIAINRIPITGREEDVADQFAIWTALNYVDLSQTPMILPTLWFWGQLAKSRNIPNMSQDERKRLMSDEHSLDEQRIFNIACWNFGFDPQRGTPAAQSVGLTPERAQRCGKEYQDMETGMRKYFGKYFKIRPLSGRW